MQKILGDYIHFFSILLHDLTRAGFDVSPFPLSHLCYRVATSAEYAPTRDALLAHCSEFTETDFNGRSIAMLWLREPLQLAPTHAFQLIELPAPKPSHTYPTGLEHAGFVVGTAELPAFNARHGAVLQGVKDRGAHCQPSFITFPSGATAKFYEHPLREVLALEDTHFTAA